MRPARIVTDDKASEVDEQFRRTKLVDVSDELAADVAQWLESIRPAIETHFKLELGSAEPAQFLAYHAGDFFQPHRDRSKSHPIFKKRKISLVLFVNEGAGAEGYSGGFLTFYGLVDQPRWKEMGFALEPTPWLLLAFPSEIIYEVTPVTRGNRYTIVSWYPEAVSP
jgi:predicted 2-oxoglutarate/Fe(II)-dependent dioxygenase YbiX